MFYKKSINVGVNEKYTCLSDVFKKYKRGKISIVMTSDLLDEQDIYIPKSIKELSIVSKDNKVRSFSQSNINIFCQGVKVNIEYLGTQDSQFNIIGTTCDINEINIVLYKCALKSIICGKNVNKVKYLSLVVRECNINELHGFLNELAFYCCKVELNIENTNIGSLYAIELNQNMKREKSLVEKGIVLMRNCIVQEICLVKEKQKREETESIQLFVMGESLIEKLLT